MENKSYTIKDIARLAGVSAGTVDRVLHDRGDVSAASREKVQRVLDAIDYHPNVYAIALAGKKAYLVACVVPFHSDDDYWNSVAQGIDRAAAELAPLNVSVTQVGFQHGDQASYRQACQGVRALSADAVLIAPNFRDETLDLTGWLDEHEVPYTFVDFNVDLAHPLCYIGQDSWSSGYLAAKILMRSYEPGQELALFLNNRRSSPAEIQMRRRLDGFMAYLAEAHPTIVIHDVVLQKDDAEVNRILLDDFFCGHEDVELGAVFNSRVYQVAEYLEHSRRHLRGLIGYDLLRRNVDCLQNGSVDWLIGQRPSQQGYCGVKALSDHVVLKRSVTPVKYMPIDILQRENIKFYFEFE